MELFPTETIATITDQVIDLLSANILVIVGVLAFIVALSVIMALFDQAADNRYLSNYKKRWGMK